MPGASVFRSLMSPTRLKKFLVRENMSKNVEDRQEESDGFISDSVKYDMLRSIQPVKRLRQLYRSTSKEIQMLNLGILNTKTKTSSGSHLTGDTVLSLRLKLEVATLLKKDAKLHLTSDGCGGAYFIKNENDQIVAVFKPREEEFMAPKNPRGYASKDLTVGISDHPIRKGFKVGNGALMERAAYMIDASYGNFSGVPETTIVKINGREGSLQRYLSHISDAEDMGSAVFNVAEVQKIGILDVRLFNTDRHAGNILLGKRTDETGRVVCSMSPIDHGFCLPSFEHLELGCFDWMYWPQSKLPFHAAALDHIASIDVERDAELLRSISIDEDRITTMKICTILLKKGANVGLSLFDIASLIHRDGDGSHPSSLEFCITRCVQKLEASIDNPVRDNRRMYGEALIKLLDERLTEIASRKTRSRSCIR